MDTWLVSGKSGNQHQTAQFLLPQGGDWEKMINYKTVNFLGHLGQVLSFLCLPQSSTTPLGIVYHINHKECFLHNSVSKESACNARDPHSIPGPGRSPGEGNGNALQYSCLGNPVDRGVWQAPGHGVARVGHDLGTKPVVYHTHRSYTPVQNIFLRYIYSASII